VVVVLPASVRNDAICESIENRARTDRCPHDDVFLFRSDAWR